jgi:hypothetical protein
MSPLANFIVFSTGEKLKTRLNCEEAKIETFHNQNGC